MTVVFRITAALLFLLPLVAQAEKLPRPRVDFSADMVIEAGSLAMTGKLFHASDRERVEQNLPGMELVVITRHDRKVGWIVLNDQKVFLEMTLDEATQQSYALHHCDARRHTIGKEMVNGMNAEKSRVTLACPDGSSYDGTVWITSDGIMIRMDAVASDGAGNYPFRLDMKNVRIAPQNMKIFEIPSAYRKMGMGEMFGAFAGMMKSLPGHEMQIERNDPPPAKNGRYPQKTREDMPGF